MLAVPVPDKLVDRVNRKPGFCVGRSGRILDAISHRLEVDPLLVDRFGEHEPGASHEFVAKAVQEKLDGPNSETGRWLDFGRSSPLSPLLRE